MFLHVPVYLIWSVAQILFPFRVAHHQVILSHWMPQYSRQPISEIFHFLFCWWQTFSKLQKEVPSLPYYQQSRCLRLHFPDRWFLSHQHRHHYNSEIGLYFKELMFESPKSIEEILKKSNIYYFLFSAHQAQALGHRSLSICWHFFVRLFLKLNTTSICIGINTSAKVFLLSHRRSYYGSGKGRKDSRYWFISIFTWSRWFYLPPSLST